MHSEREQYGNRSDRERGKTLYTTLYNCATTVFMYYLLVHLIFIILNFVFLKQCIT